jgi:hypothetical protein
MFCANCGSNVNEDVIFCPNCGKATKPEMVNVGVPQLENTSKPNQTVVFAQNIYSGNNTIPKRNYLLINFSAKMFYPFLEVSMWLTLIIGAIIGGSYGADSFRDFPTFGAIIGVIIGVLLMLFWIINFGGLISIFLKIKENVEELNRKK